MLKMGTARVLGERWQQEERLAPDHHSLPRGSVVVERQALPRRAHGDHRVVQARGLEQRRRLPILPTPEARVKEEALAPRRLIAAHLREVVAVSPKVSKIVSKTLTAK